MKRGIIIGSTVIAMILSISLFVFGAFAAFNQTFKITNSIRFEGSGQKIVFTLDGSITGTTNDDDPKLKYNWTYDYDYTEENAAVWNVGDIAFRTNGRKIAEIEIEYKFVIQNLGSSKILAYITGWESIDTEYLTPTIVGVAGNEVLIDIGETKEVSLKIKPAVEDFDTSHPCNFTVMLVEYK